ncbi:unnamed protein product [Adineta ricciae]|uniref:Arginine deiminase n=1 Tax=Adineta ricciae TaxID=249248 RepID=A0A815FE88_ADIRI|nr:unnamed protein product [Adineta ricciae]CAF1357820.1 unnamed protein product [Adineta ricciae]
MHLDTVLSSVGRHTFTLYQHLADQLPVYTVQTPIEGNGRIEWLYHGNDVRRALRHLLCDPTLHFYDAAEEKASTDEQHERRDNVLCIDNQNVITYAGGEPVNGIVGRMLRSKRYPCHVQTFPQEGLIEGFGGAHCMTNALHRLPK